MLDYTSIALILKSGEMSLRNISVNKNAEKLSFDFYVLFTVIKVQDKHLWTRVVKLLLCAYYYYYYFIYLNNLLLLLLLEMYGEPITATITITRNINEAYCYYYYFADYYHYYYFPISITFIITVGPKKHNTSRLQCNIQRPIIITPDPIVSHTTTGTLSQIISL